jgi:hypothetical protein
MHPKVYLLTELRRLCAYYNTRYTYTGQKGITINRGQVLPALQFKFDEENFYVSINHLPVSDYDPLQWKFTYSMPASVYLIALFRKLLKYNLIDDGTFKSVEQFERSRHAKYYDQRSGVNGIAKNSNSLREAS